MKVFFKLIILLLFISIGTKAHGGSAGGGGGGGGGGGLKSMSKYRKPKFKKYLDYKMVSFSEKGINNTKEFSKISKCHKMVFEGKSKVKSIEALSLDRCQNLMKRDLAFQAYYIKQSGQDIVKSNTYETKIDDEDIVKSSISDTKTNDQNKFDKRRNSEGISDNSSINRKKRKESLQNESIFFD